MIKTLIFKIYNVLFKPKKMIRNYNLLVLILANNSFRVYLIKLYQLLPMFAIF